MGLFTEKELEQLDPKEYIIIKGARVNNLKNLSVAIPRNKLTVVTGVSGSGKSSLAFDTLFAEGQRMYVESLSSYARQFLGRMEKPDVDYIKGVSPAIAIEQKVSSKNPRSTVGTTTEIYDYLKLLYARIGITYSPESGEVVKKDNVTDVVEFVNAHEEGAKILVLAPLVDRGRKIKPELEILLQKGFSRVWRNEEVQPIEEILNEVKNFSEAQIIIDRVVAGGDEANQFRIADSVQTAFFEGEGSCSIHVLGGTQRQFSDRFELDGIKFEEPTTNFFSFNNPYGACKTCDGFGHVLGIDEDLVIPDKSLSVFEGAIAPWKGEKMGEWLTPLVKNGIQFDFPIHRPFNELDEAHKALIWKGNKYFDGLHKFFKFLESQTHKIQYRVMLSRYRGRTVCPDCKGTRLRADTQYVKIDNKHLTELVLLPINRLATFFDEIKLTSHEEKIAKRILNEIKNRLKYINQVGLGYLTLNRLTQTLSGGEFQRIKLATSLGSALVGSMYILDEPSIGLHPRDTTQLIDVLLELRDMGNTVIVVEHEEEVMRAADQILDIGPDAGSHGGQLIFEGTLDQMPGSDSYTAQYLSGSLTIEVPSKRRKWLEKISIKGASENNLKNVDVDFPLNTLTVVTGVSGSGKSTLIKQILYPALKKRFGEFIDVKSKYRLLEGSLDRIQKVEFVDQNPIGKSSRSNPVTYIKAYDQIRALYADQPLAKQRGYKPAHFSFNVDGGRCELCQGEGEVTIEMQFMADIRLTCESCKGKRFKQEVVEVEYEGKSISEVLKLTVDEAITFFQKQPKLIEKLMPLQRVGLGYITLGQSSSSLSGGEAQRVKLAFFLSKGTSEDPTLFIFDEPTTGLHFHDIKKLLTAFNALVDIGHSLIVIEHNQEVVKCADWLIDLGPEGGENGGEIIGVGTPEELVKKGKGYTAKYLAEKLEKSKSVFAE